MIEGIGGYSPNLAPALAALESTQAVAEAAALALAEGHITPEVVSAGEIAQQVAEVQVENIKSTLESQTQLLDLLV